MDKRVTLAVAVSAALLAVAGAYLLTRPSEPIGGSGEKPAAVEVADQEGGKAVTSVGGAAPPGAVVEPGKRGKFIDAKVELPEGARVEDGGLAFGDAVCQHVKDCGCEDRNDLVCARGWGRYTAAEAAEVSCLLTISCEEYCKMGTDKAAAGACAAKVSELDRGKVLKR